MVPHDSKSDLPLRVIWEGEGWVSFFSSFQNYMGGRQKKIVGVRALLEHEIIIMMLFNMVGLPNCIRKQKQPSFVFLYNGTV